jgi:regulator of replication initiation timing
MKDLIRKLLAELPLSAVLRERLELLRSQIESLEKENASVKAERDDLRLKLQEAQAQIQKLQEHERYRASEDAKGFGVFS